MNRKFCTVIYVLLYRRNVPKSLVHIDLDGVGLNLANHSVFIFGYPPYF